MTSVLIADGANIRGRGTLIQRVSENSDLLSKRYEGCIHIGTRSSLRGKTVPNMSDGERETLLLHIFIALAAHYLSCFASELLSG